MTDQKDSASKDQTNRFLPLEQTPIFIINLPTCERRKKTLNDRLKYHGLVDQAIWVEAISHTDAKIEYYRKGYIEGKGFEISDKETACMASHLKAIREFVHCGKSHGLILEDDAVPHNKFRQMYNSAITKIPGSTPLLMLVAYVSDWSDIREIDSGLYNIGKKTYAALAYVITREYALEVLEKYDKPFREYETALRAVSEVITINSGGYFVLPPLVIEESLDTNIQHDLSIQWHLDYFKQFNRQGYVNADVTAENVAMLKQWQIPGY